MLLIADRNTAGKVSTKCQRKDWPNANWSSVATDCLRRTWWPMLHWEMIEMVNEYQSTYQLSMGWYVEWHSSRLIHGQQVPWVHMGSISSVTNYKLKLICLGVIDWNFSHFYQPSRSDLNFKYSQIAKPYILTTTCLDIKFFNKCTLY